MITTLLTIVMAASSPYPPVRVVFVNHVNEYPITNTEQIAAIDQVRGALTFWNRVSPFPPRLVIGGTATIEANISRAGWERELSDPAWVTVAVVVNRGGRPFPSPFGVSAYAWYYDRVVVVSTTDNTREPDFIAYATAHELGHYLYGLPDTAGKQGIDRSVPRLMDYPLEAYRRGALHPDETAWIERHGY